MSTTWPYTPYYCEENVWHLGDQPLFADLSRKAVFISNPRRKCALFYQKSSSSPQVPVIWDYHVVLISYEDKWQVWDLDTTLDLPTELPAYLDQTFMRGMNKNFAPFFRVVDFEVFRNNFSSDRSHMRNSRGEWIAPPPTWPAITIGSSSNLFDFIDMEKKSFGEVLDLMCFRTKYGTRV